MAHKNYTFQIHGKGFCRWLRFFLLRNQFFLTESQIHRKMS